MTSPNATRLPIASISRRLPFLVISTIIIASIITAIAIVLVGDSPLESAMKDHLETLAVSQAQQIDQALEGHLAQMHILSQQEAIKGALQAASNEYAGLTDEDISATLEGRNQAWREALTRENPSEVEIVSAIVLNDISAQLFAAHQEGLATTLGFETDFLLVDQHGVVIAASYLPSDYVQTNEAWWQALQAGETAYLAGPESDPTDRSGQQMGLALPIYDDSNNTIIGGLYGTVEATLITQIIDQFQESDLGHTILADHNGQAIYGPETLAEFQEQPLPIKQSMNSLQSFDTSWGETQILAVPVTSATPVIAGLDWFVVSMLARGRVVVPPGPPILPAVIVAVLSCLLFIILLEFFYMRPLTRDLGKLHAGAQALAQGDLGTRVQIERRDELGVLAGTFNEMAGRLQRSYADLEQQVANRTQELVAQTERLQASEQAVAEQRTFLRQVIDAIPDPIFVWDRDGRYLLLNQEAHGLSNANVGEVIGQEEWHAEEAKKYAHLWLAEDRQVLDSLEGFRNHESAYDQPDGSKRYYQVSKSPFFGSDDDAIGVLVTMTEVTERKRAEEALRESQEQFTQFMDMLPHRVFIKEESGQTIYLNQYNKEFFATEDAIEVPPQALFQPIPNDVEAMTINDQNTLANEPIRIEETLSDKNGNEHIFETTKFRIVRANKSPLVGGIGLNITDRVKAEQALASALERAKRLQVEAEAANRAKSRFLANMNHELRTPLNAILGFAEVIQRNKTLTEDNLENLNIISRSGEHLLTLINQVLDLSKIESEQMTLDPISTDLCSLLVEVIDMFAQTAGQKQLELHLELDEAVPRFVYVDAVKLRQVLINLVGNAVKFTERGGIMLKVEARARNQHRIPLTFQVIDTGVGIAPNERGQLFEVFSQTHSGRRANTGTGLGLSISQQFAHLMGGTISVDSQVGQGTTFEFEIFVETVTADQVEDQAYQPQRNVIALAPDQPHYRILVVDDQPINRQLVVKLLHPLGFELREAADGQQALDIWQTWQPHLIWMDMRMPVMDGYEATRQIKAQGTPPNGASMDTKIIALTASSYEEEREAVIQAGCDDYLRKPFRAADIFVLMEQHIGVRFLYAEADPQPNSIHSNSSLSTEALTLLSMEQLTHLTETIETLDLLLIEAQLEQIEQTHPELASGLKQLVHDFQFDKLLILMEEAKTHHEQF